VTYRIPANDDAIRSIKLFSKVISQAVIEANGGQENEYTPAELETAEILEEDFVVEKEEIEE
ncbi:30S ribosomal protein S2, partial [Streptobacillus notomytis]